MIVGRLVSQLDEWGCGVACAASALKISYVEAKRRLIKVKGRDIDEEPFGLELEPILEVLKNGGKAFRTVNNGRNLPIGSIVFLSEELGKYAGSGHYLLKTNDGWMNPWGNFPESKPRAEYQTRLPRNTRVQVALVPLDGYSSVRPPFASTYSSSTKAPTCPACGRDCKAKSTWARKPS